MNLRLRACEVTKLRNVDFSLSFFVDHQAYNKTKTSFL